MTISRSLTVSTIGDHEIVMTRSFDAPRRLVFDAHTKPELVKRWLGVRGGWTLPLCEIDLKVGGAYRYVWRHEGKGREMIMSGVFREIAPPERIVCTELFDDPWYPGESLVTTVLTERDGETTTLAPGACSLETNELGRLTPTAAIVEMTINCPSAEVPGRGTVPITGTVIVQQLDFVP